MNVYVLVAWQTGLLTHLHVTKAINTCVVMAGCRACLSAEMYWCKVVNVLLQFTMREGLEKTQRPGQGLVTHSGKETERFVRYKQQFCSTCLISGDVYVKLKTLECHSRHCVSDSRVNLER